jgi:hypothetical protein
LNYTFQSQLHYCYNGARISDYAWYVAKLESKSGKWTLYEDTFAHTVVCGHTGV